MKTIKRNKKGFTFMMLDFWSIVFFAAVIIILLIYVNFEKDRDDESIILKIKGVNTPHYIMNIFQSEVIEMPNCVFGKTNLTRIDALQYFNYRKVHSDKDYYQVCVGDFVSSLEQIKLNNNENLGNVQIDFDFLMGKNYLFEKKGYNEVDDGWEYNDIKVKRLYDRYFYKDENRLNLDYHGEDSTDIVLEFKNGYLKYKNLIDLNDINLFPMQFFKFTIPAKEYVREGVEEITVLVFYKPIEE